MGFPGQVVGSRHGFTSTFRRFRIAVNKPLEFRLKNIDIGGRMDKTVELLAD